MAPVNADRSLYLAAEHGDIQSLWTLFQLYMETPGPEAEARASWLFDTYVYHLSARFEQPSLEFSCKAPSESLSIARFEILTKSRPEQYVFPVIMYETKCPCSPGDTKPLIMVLQGMQDDRVPNVVRSALSRLDTVYRTKLKPCAKCNKPQPPEFIDYAQYFDRDKDLLVRCYPDPLQRNKWNYGVFWWHRDGKFELTDQRQVPIAEWHEDLLSRILKLIREGEKVWAKAALTRAMSLQPENDLYLQFLKFLRAPADRGLAEAILSEHLQRKPFDPEANAWMAELLTRTYAFTLKPVSLLDEAAEYCQRALQESKKRRTPNPHAQLIECNIAKFQNKPRHVVEEMYLSVLRFYPDYPELIFDYALFVGESDPISAARLFEKGGKLRPDDPDYANARAKMLARAKAG